MLLEALDHPKTLDFAARLGVELPTAIGHLELLWAFTAKKAPQGNVGKWPAGAVARACYWMGDPDRFLGALTESRFLDDLGPLGLCVHDWHDHAPRWVKAKLKQARLAFLTTAVPPSWSTTVATTVSTGSPTHRVEKPSQAKPRVGKEAGPLEPSTAVAPAVGPSPGTPEVDVHATLEAIRLVYPAGTYGAQNWILAERELHTLVDAGETAADLEAAAAAYREQQDDLGNIGSNFIRSPEKFYRDGWWRGPFPKARARAAPGRKSFEEIHKGLSTAAGDA